MYSKAIIPIKIYIILKRSKEIVQQKDCFLKIVMQVIKRTFTYFIMFYEFSFNFIQLLRKKLFMWKEILINKTIVKQFYSLRRKSLVAYLKFANHCVKLSNKRGMKVMISNFFYTLGYFNKHNWYNEIKSFDLTDNNVIETWAQMIS